MKNRGKEVDGKSLRPLLYETESQWPDRTMVTDSQREDFLIKWKETAVMTQRWRLVNPTLTGDPTKLELYDMPKDPSQMADVASKFPEVVQSLVGQYDAWWSRASANGDRYVRAVLGSLIKPTDKFVEFVVSLPKGEAGLRTTFYDADLNARGAYYVYVERL